MPYQQSSHEPANEEMFEYSSNHSTTALTPKQKEANILIKDLRKLVSALPERASTLSLISAINNAILKLKLPIIMQGAEVPFILLQLIMAFIKVNVWIWANDDMSDPHKNMRVAAVFSIFMSIIPSILSYLNLLTAQDARLNHAIYLKHAAVGFVGIFVIPPTFYSAADTLCAPQENFSEAAQQAIAMAAYVVLSSDATRRTSTAGLNFMIFVYKRLFQPMFTRIARSSCFQRLCYREEGSALLVDNSSELGRSRTNTFSDASTSHDAYIVLMTPDQKRILQTLKKYDSLPHQFLFCLVLLFIMKMFYQPFANFLSGDLNMGEYGSGNFLAGLAILFCLTLSNVEAKLTEIGIRP